MTSDEETFFDQGLYFRLENDISPNTTLRIDSKDDPEVRLIVKPFDDDDNEDKLTENWHLYFQSGRYFIRNHEHGRDWQLSLSEENQRFPMLRRRAPDLGQQWIIEEAGSASAFRLTNELRGRDYALGLSRDGDVPTMDRVEDGSIWKIGVNTGVDPVPSDMQDEVELVTPTTSGTATSTSTSTSTPSSKHSPDDSSSSSSLSAGAIAGISIGAAAVVILAILAVLLSRYSRRRRRQSELQTVPVPAPQEEREKEYPPATTMSPVVAELDDQDRGKKEFGPPQELHSDSLDVDMIKKR